MGEKNSHVLGPRKAFLNIGVPGKRFIDTADGHELEGRREGDVAIDQHQYSRSLESIDYCAVIHPEIVIAKHRVFTERRAARGESLDEPLDEARVGRHEIPAEQEGVETGLRQGVEELAENAGIRGGACVKVRGEGNGQRSGKWAVPGERYLAAGDPEPALPSAPVAPARHAFTQQCEIDEPFGQPPEPRIVPPAVHTFGATNPDWPSAQDGITKLYLTSAARFVPLAVAQNKLFLYHISYHLELLNLIMDRMKIMGNSSKLVTRHGYDCFNVQLDPNDRRYIYSP
jgi:hypothetical protein